MAGPVPGQALFPDGMLINVEYLQEYATNFSFVNTNIFFVVLPSLHVPAGDTLTLFSVENIIPNITMVIFTFTLK